MNKKAVATALGRQRRGIAELQGTLLSLVITIIAGAAVFGFVNGQASNSAKVYGDSVNTYVQTLQEKFVIANIATNYPSSNKIKIWFYNSGDIDTNVTEIYVGTSESSLSKISSSSLPLTITKGSSASLEIDYTLTSGQIYYIKAVASLGNTRTSSQKA
jgi:flagellin-like protein